MLVKYTNNGPAETFTWFDNHRLTCAEKRRDNTNMRLIIDIIKLIISMRLISVDYLIGFFVCVVIGVI